jgi:hypothetical protein
MNAREVLTSVVAGAAKAVEAAREVSNSPGAVPLWASWRKGLTDVHQGLKAFPDSIQSPSEPGEAGTVTQMEVQAAKEGEIEMDHG